MVVGTCGCLSQTKPRPRKVCLVHGHSEPYSAKQHTWNLWSATKKTVSPKTCHTSPRPQQGKARSGLVRRSSEAPQLCTSCGFVWGDNGPFTAVLMAKCCLFVPPKIGPGFGWYPVRRCTTEEVKVKPWIFGRQKELDPPLYWNIIFLRSDMFASLLLGHISLPSMSIKPLNHSKILKLIFNLFIHVPSEGPEMGTNTDQPLPAAEVASGAIEALVLWHTVWGSYHGT